jgi:oxalate decarboxylase/phosphoglucose isomerase-like protein (cupin superfamily)
LLEGESGAVPHRHDNASELFYICDGELEVLIGTDVLTASRGDLVVVPPSMSHAFAAGPRTGAETLIVMTPGIKRFEYFHHVVARRNGTEPASVLETLQERFDTYFVTSDAWSARAASVTIEGSVR